MKIAVLGTGMVGQALASQFVALGHDTCMGSRSASHAGANEWAAAAGPKASTGTFAQAAATADVVVLAVKGEHALSVVEAAGDALNGKVVMDLTNPLDFSKGFPPRLFVCNDDSLGEQLQRAASKAKVVKTLNTLGAPLMVDPGLLPDATEVFVAGNDVEAKRLVSGLLESLGHKSPIDLGGIDASRGLEAWLLLWTRLYGAFGTGEFNLKLVRK